MKQIKKHAIGYNTVSSKNGIISARGVKSYPTNLEIYGYTHEVGTGEKSPDNPYQLVSLDSGNVNLYSEDKITDIQVKNDGTTRKGFEIDASMFKSKCVVVHFDITTSSVSTIGIALKFLYKNGLYQSYNSNSFINAPKFYKITKDVEKILIFSSGSNETNNYFYVYENLMILDSPIMPSEYITDEHSIILSNNDMSIQVPIPIALNSFEDVSDCIFKNSEGTWKVIQNNKKHIFIGTENISLQSINDFGIANFLYTINEAIYEHSYVICNLFKTQTSVIADTETEGYLRTRNFNTRSKLIYFRIKSERASTVEEFKSFLAEQYEALTPLTIVYQLETPIEHVLSDYAQDLLNSFELQNQNRIFVEGYPDIKISGYIQK